jgi:hypothetical protein
MKGEEALTILAFAKEDESIFGLQGFLSLGLKLTL